MLAAVVFGTTAATFAVGLATSLDAVASAQHPAASAVVQVVPGLSSGGGPGGPHGGPGGPPPNPPGGQGGPPPSPPGSAARVRAAIQAQPGTAWFYGNTMEQVSVQGVAGSVDAQLYDDASGRGAYQMISGHWFTGPGQVVVPTHFLDVTGTRIGDTVTVVMHGTQVPLRIVGEAFDPGDSGMRLHADASSFASVKGVHLDMAYSVALKHGVAATAYLTGLNAALRPLNAEGVVNQQEGGSLLAIVNGMAAILTLMLVVVAGLGVLNSVVLDTRERVHDLGVCKAVGMSPRQTTIMVLASVTGLGVVGGIIGVPIGIALHDYILPVMGSAAGTGLTPQIEQVYHGLELVLLGLAGVAIAVLGAMLPASWAAKARTATALRTE